MAERIGDAFVRVHFSSNGKELRDDVEKDPEFTKAGTVAGNKMGDGFNDSFTKKLEDGLRRREAAIKGNTTKTTKEVGRLWDKFYADQRENTDRLNRSWRDINETWDRMVSDMVKDEPDVDRRWDRLRSKVIAFEQRSIRTASLIVRAWEGTFTFLGRNFARIGTDLDATGNKVATAFGARGRNNFVNIFGRSIGGVVEVISRLFTGASKLFGLFSGAGIDAFKQVEESASKAAESAAELGDGAGGAVSSLGKFAAAAPAWGVAIIAVGVALSLAASAAMLLTGAIIALAGSLSFALVGGIVAAAGALVPLAAGVGVAMLAIKGMDKETKKAFSGVGDSFNQLTKVASAHLFKNAAADAKLFGGAVDSVLPLVAGIAEALRGVGEAFLRAMSGPGAQKFIGFLSTVLPGMIRTIGKIAINLGGAFAGLFTAATPLIEEFLGWLLGVSQALNDMGKRPNASGLTGFFDQAKKSMEAVGGLIEQVLGLIGDLFEAGAPTGDTMFTDITKQVQKFREFLAKAKKDGSLQKFFDDAKDLARALGRVVVQVGKFIAALDTPASRKMLIFMVRYFGLTLKVITDLIRFTNKMNGAIIELAGKIGKLKGIAQDVGSAIKNGIGNAWDWVKGKAGDAASWIKGKFNDLLNFIKGLLSGDPGAWTAAAKNLATTAFNAIIGIFTGLPGQIVNMFTGLGGKIVDAIGDIHIPIHFDIPGGKAGQALAGPLAGLVSASGGIFAGAQFRVIGEAGPEAVVPLSGPLNQVDPAVRELAAFARGQTSTSVTGRGGRSITTGPITIITPTKDPSAVATQVVNRIAAASYI